MSEPPTTQPVSRRGLGKELRRLRNAARLKASDAAAHLGCSETRISRMETGKGRVVAKAEEIVKLCELYGVQDERKIEILISMAATPQEPGWWDPYREVLPSGLEVLFGLETDARSERAWEPVLIHGLLQTPEYARAILQATPSNRPQDIPELVEARTERQKLLTRSERPLELWTIVDEWALHRPVGGTAVMREQIAHLLDLAALPNVTLQIIPRSKGAHPGLGGAFALLDFEDNDPVVYVDSPVGNLYLEKKQDIRKFTTNFDLLRAIALDPDESTSLLRSAAKET